MGRLAVVWLAFVGFVTSAAAEEAKKIQLLPGPFELPEKLGPLEFEGPPHEFGDPAAGIGYQYATSGYSLTIYVYDAGLKDIPDGAESTPVCLQSEEAIEGVRHAPGYSKTAVVKEVYVQLRPGADWPVARETEFLVERDGTSMKSFAWVTAAAGYFVKFRLTVEPDRAESEIASARRLMIYALGAIVKAHLKPRVHEPEGAAVKKPEEDGSIVISAISGVNEAEMGAGAAYLGALSVLGNRYPERRPRCGGDYLPSFEDELSAWQTVLPMIEGDKGSHNLVLIVEAARAGYLEELVWVGMHREEWGTSPPEGLDLAGFRTWGKKQLKNFVRPSIGTLRFDRPRALPTEPAPARP